MLAMAIMFSIPRGGLPEIKDASWIRATGDDLPCPVLVRLGIGDDGTLVATGLLLEMEEGHELSTRASRVPLAQIVGEFAAATTNAKTYKRLAAELHGYDESVQGTAEWAAWQPENVSDAGWKTAEFVAVPAEGPDALKHKPVGRTRPGRRGYSEDHWRMVARAYRQAKRTHPRAPIRALMAELHASEPTVHRWLRTARERGYLKGQQP